jgi:hypothetical protein
MSDPLGTVSWWELDEASASAPAIAFGPVANHGSYSAGGLTFGGRAGGLGFNGTSGVVTVPDAGSLDFANSWAVWCVVKRGATGAVRTLISKGDKTYCLQLDATGKPQLRDNGVILCTASSALDTNTHTILAGRNGTTASIYVDGVQVATTAAAANVTTANALPLRLGADTTAAGAVQAYFNGTLFAAAVMNSDAITSPSVGPVVLPALGVAVPTGQLPQYGITVPALLSTYRDPADTTNVTGSLEVLFGHGRTAMSGAGSWSSTAANGTGGATGSITVDASGHGTFTLSIANALNGRSFDLSITGGTTTWSVAAIAQWAIARMANVALGTNVTGLAVAPALMPAPANHVGAVLIRAATGPANSSYAPGSSWTLNPATVQSQLPAVAAYLAAQVQLVRTA